MIVINYIYRTALLSMLLAMSMTTQALVVLQYHHVDAQGPASTSLSPAQFVEHMQLLEELGFEVVDLEKATLALLDGKTQTDPSSKQVAISFDDAYTSIITAAYPELKRRNWPFTIFVNPLAVNQKNRNIMSWEQLQQLVDDGVTIANHSDSHAHLPTIPEGYTLDQWLNEEVTAPYNEMKKRLGKVSTMFAYPYGEFTLDIANWLQERNILAFGQQSGPIGPHSHPQALSRFPAAGIYANPETLKTKIMSMALPVAASEFINPIVADDNNPPKMTIELIKADYNPKLLQCFASQQGAVETTVETHSTANGEVLTLTTQAPEKFKIKRARYNCTVPSSQKGRYYWYSQPWQMY